jgi:hexosaminidase
MKKYAFLLALLSIHSFLIAQIQVVPFPENLAMGKGQFRINSNFSISTAAQDPVFIHAVNRFYQQLNRQTSAYFIQDYITPGLNGTMRIQPGNAQALSIGMDESYQLVITPQAIDLKSNTTVGAMRGLQTLIQLLAKDEQGFYFPEVTIQDKPRFAWRGLMIDVARHFIPFDVVKRNIDAMATVKMNVLHLHLTDDEGFRIESKQFPKLHQLGSNGEYYTQEEMKQLIQYAAERGIMIIPEFDLPGHSQSWFVGYPELASLPGPYKPGPRFNTDNVKSIADMMVMIRTAPTPSIDPTKESVYQFLDKFLGEMKNLFPYAYVHVGADENNGAAWKANPQIQQFMKKNKIADTRALEDYFIKRMYGIVSKQKYRMIVWEEGFTKELPKDVIVQKWKPDLGLGGGTPLTISTIVQQGNDVLVSSGFYLDHHFPAYIYYQNQALSQYASQPPVNAKGKVLGGEAAEWTEIADGKNIETRIWVNAAAIAERLWSPANRTDVNDLYTRLMKLNLLLDAQGLQHFASYERALRGWKGASDVSDLRLLTDVLTPVKGYKRLIPKMSLPKNRKQATAPLNELVDCLPMNSFTKRQFRQWVAAYLQTQDRDAAKAIRAQLQAWSYLQWNSYQQPTLEAIRPHAVNLQQLSKLALEAMDQRDKGIVLLDWVSRQQDLLKKAGQPVAETELDVLPELAALINGKLVAEPGSYSLF